MSFILKTLPSTNIVNKNQKIQNNFHEEKSDFCRLSLIEQEEHIIISIYIVKVNFSENQTSNKVTLNSTGYSQHHVYHRGPSPQGPSLEGTGKYLTEFTR